MKNCNGFSYVEVVIAFLIFIILFSSSILLIGQSARNMNYARETYIAHLNAQNLMLTIRDDIENLSVEMLEGLAENFSVWIVGGINKEFHSNNVPNTSLNILGLNNFFVSYESSIIVVAIWNEYGNISGRAIGVLR